MDSAGSPAREERGPTRQVLATRVLGFDEALQNRMCSERRRLPFGVSRRTLDIPKVHGLTCIQLDRPATWGELAPVLEAEQRALAHRRLWITRPEVGWGLGSTLDEQGFACQRLAFLVHDRVTLPAVSPVGYDVVDSATFNTYAREFVAEQPWGGDAEVIEQMAQRDARLEARMGARFVMSRDAKAGCHVYRRGTIAQIEELGVLTEARGQGLATGLVAAAMQLCEGAETLFVVADADDWPFSWYQRLGFAPVASAWEWSRKLD